MKLTVSDLREHLKGFDKLPQGLKTMGISDYLIVYCNYITSATDDIKVVGLDTVINVSFDVLAKRTKLNASHVGVFRQPFDTKDALFYFFIKSFVGKDNAKEFIYWAVEQDAINKESESTAFAQGTYSITNRSSFETALGEYLYKKKSMQSVMLVYDLVDSFTQNKFGKSIYGGYVKKVVNLIKQTVRAKDGEFEDLFLISEENGTVRYMIVGEHSSAADKDGSLTRAKEMLRLKYKVESIFDETKWFYNKFDGRWRKYITDEGARLMEAEKANGVASIEMDDTGEIIDMVGLMYYPKGCALDEKELYDSAFKTGSGKYDELMNDGYNGTLGDFLHHPELYKHYPEAFNLPFFYFRNAQENRHFCEFYNISAKPERIVINSGSQTQDDVFTIVLHETQHFIQNIENFGSGGNLFMSKLLTAVGGADLRKFFTNLSMVEADFCKNDFAAIYDDFMVNYNDIVHELDNQFNDSIMQSCKNSDTMQNDCGGIVRNLLFAILMQPEDINKHPYKGKLIDFVAKYTSAKTVEAIASMRRSISDTEIISKNLNNKGFNNQQVGQIFFDAYESLAGEIESRSVQHLSFTEEKLVNYFTPYSSEYVLDYKVGVLYGKPVPTSGGRKIEAGLEYIASEDKYILHHDQGFSVVPFLHELGHIVYDLLKTIGDNTPIIDAYNAKYVGQYSNEEEFFCDYMMTFLRKKDIDADLTTNLFAFSNEMVEPSIDEVLVKVFETKSVEEHA